MPWRIAAAALVGCGVTAAGLIAVQRSLIYQSGREAPEIERSAIPGFREVTVTTADGLDLIAWYLGASDGKPVIVMFHGNAGHIGHRTGKLAALAEAGHGLFLMEYRGYGGNPGKPDEDGLYADGRAALDWLAAEGIAGDGIVVYGESLGTGVAVAMAAEHDIAALVLEAPFDSLASVAGHHYWFVPFAGHAVFDRYASDEKIAGIGAPVLMMHGTKDPTIPLKFAEALHEAAVEPRELWIAPEAGHNDLYDHGAAEVVLDFLGTHVGNNPAN
ncbi:MAG: alpha/beta hydrolase [Rhodospirillales bacterium]|nr:alpha/beta hydrolase [Rhodospirillales bacterium]